MIALFLQLLGLAVVIAGATLVAPFLGLIVGGVFLFALGWVLDGMNNGPSTADGDAGS